MERGFGGLIEQRAKSLPTPKVFPTEECPNGACFSIVSHRNDKKYETKGCTTDLSQKRDEFVHFDSDNR